MASVHPRFTLPDKYQRSGNCVAVHTWKCARMGGRLLSTSHNQAWNHTKKLPRWNTLGIPRPAPGAIAYLSPSDSETDQSPSVIQVCTSKACRKDGAFDTLALFEALAPPSVTVEASGCLGKCGSGPNVALSPPGVTLSHCGTASHISRLLHLSCGGSDPQINLQALELKNKGNALFQGGSFAEAEEAFSQAIELQPSGGLHNIYANRSAVRVVLGNGIGSLEDAAAALDLKPEWPSGLVRKAEALALLGRKREALDLYMHATDIDGDTRRSKLTKRRIRELQEQVDS